MKWKNLWTDRSWFFADQLLRTALYQIEKCLARHKKKSVFCGSSSENSPSMSITSDREVSDSNCSFEKILIIKTQNKLLENKINIITSNQNLLEFKLTSNYQNAYFFKALTIIHFEFRWIWTSGLWKKWVQEMQNLGSVFPQTTTKTDDKKIYTLNSLGFWSLVSNLKSFLFILDEFLWESLTINIKKKFLHESSWKTLTGFPFFIIPICSVFEK